MNMASQIPDIELLRAFRQVAVDRSFTRAASTLNVTQSAISHRVKKLERQIGKVLFQRSPHAVELTKAGVDLLAQIEPALAQLERTFLKAPKRTKTILEIELESAFASNWLTPRIGDFLDQNPNVHVEFHFSAGALEFKRETEIAIKWGKPYWSGFNTSWLMPSCSTPVCAPSLLENAPLDMKEDLSFHKLLHDRDRQAWKKWASFANVDNLETDTGHIFQDTLALHQAAIDGHGIALFPVELTNRSIERGDLIMPFPDLSFSELGSYYLIQRPGTLSPMAKSFVRWLKGRIKTEYQVRQGQASEEHQPSS